jgi:hypothetical protein
MNAESRTFWRAGDMQPFPPYSDLSVEDAKLRLALEELDDVRQKAACLLMALRHANDMNALMARRIKELEGAGNVRQGKAFDEQQPAPSSAAPSVGSRRHHERLRGWVDWPSGGPDGESG